MPVNAAVSMKSMIQLTHVEKRRVWVDPNHLACIAEHESYTEVWLVGDPIPLKVLESPETILLKELDLTTRE